MQKRALRLTEIGNPGFVDCRCTDGPGVREVHLLRASSIIVAKARQQVGRYRLKSCEGLAVEAVVEVVIETQVLLVANPVVDLQGELVFMRIIVGNGSEEAVDTS